MDGLERLSERLQAQGWGARLLRDEPLARHTTFRVGGPADLLLTVERLDELVACVRLMWQGETPVLLLGGGANVLVADAGVRGLVVINHCAAAEIDAEGLLRVETGRALAELAQWCAAQGWGGLEWAAGIPGTVGGAVVGNAGAYGGYMADCVQRIQLLLPSGVIEEWPVERLEYGYRTSALKRLPHSGRRPVVLRAWLALHRSDAETLARAMARINALRQERTPRGCCAGSVFKRTVQYPAGFLIEQAGLKGLRRGGAVVSSVHANFIMNDGDATAAEVLALAREVQRRVWLAFGQHLEPEVELVGAWPTDDLDDPWLARGNA